MKAILTTIVAAWILVLTLFGPMAQQVADAADQPDRLRPGLRGGRFEMDPVTA